MPNYSQDWFSESIPFLERGLKEFVGKPFTNFLEIGSYEGRSAIWFLENILTGENSGITCIDDFSSVRMAKDNGVFEYDLRDRFLSNMRDFKGKYMILEGRSQYVMRQQNFNDIFDAVYVDGSHRADDTLEDLINSLYALKSGGYLLIDDYLWNYDQYPIHEVPKKAVDSFLEIYKDKVKPTFLSNKLAVLQKK